MKMNRSKMMKILIVDDNRTFRDALVEYVTSISGVTIVGQAGNGQEAILKAQLLQPDLVLMDISMDAMDGFRAASLIKEQLTNVKIIFITVHEEETYRYLAALVQADGFVWKNSLDELPTKIHRLQNMMNTTEVCSPL